MVQYTAMPRPRAPQGVKVVLGPTNTGKTHLAVERMLGHSSGVIGLPLRLLAREIYDRVIRIKPPSEVALITGEEKIVPKNARYWVATTEAMPLAVEAAFVAVDEIQLCADSDRGHVFTDRLLHARGREESMFMGAETMRPLITALLPGAEIITRPRFSALTAVPPLKLSRLPRRTAFIAFSVSEVYALAEMLRRHRGGAAVVMGALSPRTRNAQVALYQNGDVDYIVATDAIGMGLNMDIDHVAFAATRKFDGERYRPLTAPEVAQIAGRAGRHMNDGSFSTVAELVEPFAGELTAAVEAHRFPVLETLEWRNSRLNFSTPEALVASLEATPNHKMFRRSRESEDLAVLKIAVAHPETRALARGPAALRLLWDACQIPDFRKLSPLDHAQLCLTVYKFLMSDQARVPDQWFDRQLKPLDRVDGDIDTLAQRIAHVRTWTYAANRPNWLGDPDHWQSRTRAVEDRLSDALHERLSQRFIDRRTTVLMRELRQKERLMAVVEKDGSVSVEGHYVGALEGFAFKADETTLSADGRTLRQAAEKALGRELAERARALSEAGDELFTLTLAEPIGASTLNWNGVAVAELSAGPDALKPRVRMLPAPLLTSEDLHRVEARLQRWLDAYLDRELKPLYRLRAALDDPDCIGGLARGLAYQLVENLGTLSRRRVAADFRAVDKDGRRQMRSQGIWLGAASLYLPQLLKPLAARLRLLLWTVHSGQGELPVPPTPGLITIETLPSAPANFYEILGFRPVGGLAVRLDMLERLGQAAREIADKGPFALDARLMSLVGVSGDDFIKIMGYLGYAYRAPSEKEAESFRARTAAAAAMEAEAATAATVPETPEAEAAPAIETSTETEMPTAEAVAAAETAEEATVAAPNETLPETLPETLIETPAEASDPAGASEESSGEKTAPAVPDLLFFREEPWRQRQAFRKDRSKDNRSGERRPRNRPARSEGRANDQAASGPNDGAASRAEKGANERTGGRHDGGARPERQPRNAGPRPQRVERKPAFDADSPFAVLAGLKQTMRRK